MTNFSNVISKNAFHQNRVARSCIKIVACTKMIFMFGIFHFFIPRQVKILVKKSHKNVLAEKESKTLSDTIYRKDRKRHEDFSVDGSIKDLHMSDFVFLFLSDWLMTETWLEFWRYLGLSLSFLLCCATKRKGTQSIRDCLQRIEWNLTR